MICIPVAVDVEAEVVEPVVVPTELVLVDSVAEVLVDPVVVAVDPVLVDSLLKVVDIEELVESVAATGLVD